MDETMLAETEGAEVDPESIRKWAREALMAVVFARRRNNATDELPRLRNGLRLLRSRFPTEQQDRFPSVEMTLAMDRVFPHDSAPAMSDLEAEAHTISGELELLITNPSSIEPESLASIEDFFRHLVIRAAA